MPTSELSRIFMLPVSCPRCEHEAEYSAGFLAAHDKIVCSCGATIDVNTPPWMNFKHALVNALSSVQPFYEAIPD
jgi:hypothetical protein